MEVYVDIFIVFDVKMNLIWTFPADPNNEQVPILAKRVACFRYPINLRSLHSDASCVWQRVGIVLFCFP